MENVKKQIQKWTRQIAIVSTLLLIYTIVITIWSTCNGCMQIETNQFLFLVFGLATGKLTILTATAATTIGMTVFFYFQEACERLVSWQQHDLS